MLRPAIVALVLAVSSAAFAQAGPPPIDYDAFVKAPEGSWAQYVTTIKGQEKSFTMKHAVVEKSAKKIVLEVDGQTPLGYILAQMVFVPGDQPDTWKITSQKMSMEGQPPQEAPPSNVVLKKGTGPGPVVGTSTVKTPVGTYETKQYKITLPQGTVNVWLTDKVPPVGLVKQEAANGAVTTTLSATGTGATSKMAELLKKTAKPATEEKAKPAPKK
jgi:hypothetical protein